VSSVNVACAYVFAYMFDVDCMYDYDSAYYYVYAYACVYGVVVECV